MATPRALLDVDAATFLTSGVGIFVSSASPSGAPSLCFAYGCDVSRDRREVRLFVSRQEGADVLADVEAGGRVAAVFSLPSTLRTLQLKARSGQVRPLRPDDLPSIERNVRLATLDLSRIGFGGAYAAQSFDEPRDQLVALVISPSEAFNQTPGPRAGTPLERGA